MTATYDVILFRFQSDADGAVYSWVSKRPSFWTHIDEENRAHEQMASWKIQRAMGLNPGHPSHIIIAFEAMRMVDAEPIATGLDNDAAWTLQLQRDGEIAVKNRSVTQAPEVLDWIRENVR